VTDQTNLPFAAVPVLLLLLLLLLLQCHIPLPAAEASDLLQLAINCSYWLTAASAVSCFPTQLEPTAAGRMLLTATVRHAGKLATRVAAAPAVKPHLDALLEVLRAAAACRGGRGLFTEFLFGLPNVQQLEPAVVPTRPARPRQPRMPEGTRGCSMGRGRPLTLGHDDAVRKCRHNTATVCHTAVGGGGVSGRKGLRLRLEFESDTHCSAVQHHARQIRASMHSVPVHVFCVFLCLDLVWCGVSAFRGWLCLLNQY
jgi:hypothetical protein